MINNELTLSIVGTAGRGQDYDKLNLVIYNEMYRIADKLLDYINNSSPIKLTMLVSGGAAFADHLAVRLYLNNRIPNLRLYLPCDYEDGKFIDNYSDFGTVADTANWYHSQFEKETKQNSIKEIQKAIEKGADVTVVHGFKNRNTNVSMSNYILAMTFGEKETLKDGGTKDTLEKYLNRIKEKSLPDGSFHFNLNEMKMYRYAKVN